jgi:hypothetical protein
MCEAVGELLRSPAITVRFNMRYYFTLVCSLGAGAAAAAIGKGPPKGFVTTDGTGFKLGKKDFYFAGSNAYYLPFNDVNLTLPICL